MNPILNITTPYELHSDYHNIQCMRVQYYMGAGFSTRGSVLYFHAGRTAHQLFRSKHCNQNKIWNSASGLGNQPTRSNQHSVISDDPSVPVGWA